MYSLLFATLLVTQQLSIADSYIDPVNGLSWQQLVGLAKERQADLLAARQSIEIARGKLLQSAARPNPTLSTEYTTQRLTTGEEEYDFSVEYSQTLELAHKRAKRRLVAELDLERTQALYLYDEAKLITLIRQNMVEALAAVETLRTLELQLQINEQMLELTRTRLEAGDASVLEQNLLKAERERTKLLLVAAEARLKLAISELKVLAGLEQATLRLKGDLSEYIKDFSTDLELLTQKAFAQRKDLQALKAAEKQAEAKLALAKAEAIPDIIIFSRYSQDNSVFEDTPIGKLNDPDRSLSFGVSLQLPFFNRNRGHIAAEAASAAQARYALQAAKRQIVRAISQALTQLETASATLQLYENTILPTMRQNLAILRTAYELGEQSLLDLLNEQRKLFEEERLYIEAIKQKALASIELELATGTTP
ncbi:MAG: TolC family protein [Acidobacteriota bacterium]|nr:TolC family protein [Blastocatellia bacterium]MDW8411326.1 TolC family protein [Acidobacteriota bacterium]